MQSSNHRWNGAYNTRYKRIADVALAIFGIALLLPLYCIVACAIVLESGCPVLYRAQRGGYHGRPFVIFKFRSMIKNADKIGGGTTSLHDPRITRVGHFIRKTKLDEIPQLFNILRGDMSVIGPRPELLHYTDKYDDTEQVIMNVRPGLTDYSSIAFINLDEIVGSGEPDEVYERVVLKEKNKLRVKYAETVSLRTDAYLLILTIMKVSAKIGQVMRGRHKQIVSTELRNRRG